MARIPADELAEIYGVVERAAAKAVRKYGLDETDGEDLSAVGLIEAIRCWERWAFDSGIPLAGFLADPVYWAIRHEVDKIMGRRRKTRALDVERMEQVAAEDYAETDPRLARLDALASQHRSVAIYIALEHGGGYASEEGKGKRRGKSKRPGGEEPAAVAARYPGAAGQPMAYCVLWTEYDAGHAIVFSDPVLRALFSERWVPGEVAGDLPPVPAQSPFRMTSRPWRRRTPRRPSPAAPPSCEAAGLKRETAAGTFQPTPCPRQPPRRTAGTPPGAASGGVTGRVVHLTPTAASASVSGRADWGTPASAALMASAGSHPGAWGSDRSRRRDRHFSRDLGGIGRRTGGVRRRGSTGLIAGRHAAFQVRVLGIPLHVWQAGLDPCRRSTGAHRLRQANPVRIRGQTPSVHHPGQPPPARIPGALADHVVPWPLN